MAAAYAALKNSNALNIIRVTEKQKGDVEEDAKDKQLHHDFHIRFSIPLSSVHDALDPAGAAAKTAARLKRELKRASKSPGLRHSASVSKLPFNSLDPFNQGVGFGTGTLDGAGSATLVLRLPDERCTSLPMVFTTPLSTNNGHVLTVLHRSAYSTGKLVQDRTSRCRQVPAQPETQAWRRPE